MKKLHLPLSMFGRLSREIEQGRALWAILTLNEYEAPINLRQALCAKATQTINANGLTAALSGKILAGHRFADFSARLQSRIKQVSKTRPAEERAAAPLYYPNLRQFERRTPAREAHLAHLSRPSFLRMLSTLS